MHSILATRSLLSKSSIQIIVSIINSTVVLKRSMAGLLISPSYTTSCGCFPDCSVGQSPIVPEPVSRPVFVHHFLRSGVLLRDSSILSALRLPFRHPVDWGVGLEPTCFCCYNQLSYRFRGGLEPPYTDYGGDTSLMQQHTDSYYVCTMVFLNTHPGYVQRVIPILP